VAIAEADLGINNNEGGLYDPPLDFLSNNNRSLFMSYAEKTEDFKTSTSGTQENSFVRIESFLSLADALYWFETLVIESEEDGYELSNSSGVVKTNGLWRAAAAGRKA